MIFSKIAKFVRSRGIKAIMAFSAIGYVESADLYDEGQLELYFQQDLSSCFCHNPSVIKRDYLYGGINSVRVWEMYHSSNGNVYVYYPPTGERRIFTS